MPTDFAALQAQQDALNAASAKAQASSAAAQTAKAQYQADPSDANSAAFEAANAQSISDSQALTAAANGGGPPPTVQGAGTPASAGAAAASQSGGPSGSGGMTTAAGPPNQNPTTPITQSERLFTTRSRNVNFLGGGGNRGQRTYIKLLTSNPSQSLSQHLQALGSNSTSLGTASGGPLADAINGNPTFLGYASFLLTDIQCQFEEKMQVTEVFGDSEVVYYFGRNPIQVEFGGVLIDSVDNNWFTQWMDMYAGVMRGTQLARNYELLQIVTPNMTLIGTINRTSWNQNSARDVDIPFRFSFLAKQVIPTPVIPTGAPLTSGASTALGTSSAGSFTTQSQITNQKSLLGNLQGVIQNPMSTVQQYASALNSTGSLGSTINSPMASAGSLTGAASSALGGLGLGSFTGGTSATGTSKAGTAAAPLDIFTNVSSSLAGIRASLVSPVYGVITSLTKLVGAGTLSTKVASSSASASSGSASSNTSSASGIFGSLSSTVGNIVRDVSSIAKQASSIVATATSGVKTAEGILKNAPAVLGAALNANLASVKSTAGIITSAPQSATSGLRNAVGDGIIPASTPFLNDKTGGSSESTPQALLNSGADYTPASGAFV